jgi:hypothetical protein
VGKLDNPREIGESRNPVCMRISGFRLSLMRVNLIRIHTLTLDVLKPSEIKGEILDKEQVRSSIARRLGMDIGALAPVSSTLLFRQSGSICQGILTQPLYSLRLCGSNKRSQPQQV